jgi:exonuclease VII large subunit
VARAGERLAAAAGRLEAASPLQLLARGWSLTWREDEQRRSLRSIGDLAAGTRLVTQLADGRIWSTVERTAKGRDAGLPRLSTVTDKHRACSNPETPELETPG